METNVHLWEDSEILPLVEKCKNQDPKALQKFFDFFSSEIYNFPIKVFRLSEDDAGDFYLFAFERLKDGKRFISFRGESTFRTWFYSVLRNLVIDFLRNKEKEKQIQVYFYGDNNEIEYQHYENQNYDWELDINNLIEKLYGILNQLDNFNSVVYKLVYLHYLNLNSQDIEYLKKEFHKENYEIMKFILEMKSKIGEKSIKNQEKIYKLNRIYLKIKKLKQQKEKIENSEILVLNQKMNKLSVNIDKVIEEKLKKRGELSRNLKNEVIFLRVPYEKIANFLGISTPTISSTIKKVEIFLKNHEELKKFFVKL